MFKERKDLSVNDENNETLCIEIVNKNKKNTIVCTTTYRPPNGKVKPFKDFFTYLTNKNKRSPIINKPTRVTKNSATAIDHIITNSYLNSIIETGLIKTDISDHFPIYIISNSPDIDVSSKTTEIYKRKINEKTIMHFKSLLKNTNWNSIYQFNCPNQAYNCFLKHFAEIYDTAFPEYKIEIKTKSLLSPWITRGIIKSSKRKHKLYDKYLSSPPKINK